MFDPSAEPLIPLQQVPRRIKWLPRRRRGRPIHPSTVFRWASHGLRGIRLETYRFGGTLCTNETSLRVFIERLSDPRVADTAETLSQIQQRHEAAERALDAEGV